MWAAQNEINVAPIDPKRALIPAINFPGKLLPKASELWYGEMRMVRNIMREVSDKERATNVDITKILKAGFPRKLAAPSLLFPPGKVVEAAKVTAAMRLATTEKDWDVLLSHSPPPSRLLI